MNETGRTTLSDEDLVEDLVASDEYQQLLHHESPFDLFRIVGSLSENASSRALAYVLESSEDHGLGTVFFDNLLQNVYRETKGAVNGLTMQQLLCMKGAETSATTEWSTTKGRRIDIVVRVFDEADEVIAVLGIENKHWAEEQDDQVSDYQAELMARFPGDIQRLLLFLSPGARPSRTAKQVDGCPHVECSYMSVVASLRACSEHAKGPLQVFLDSLANHLELELEDAAEMNGDVKSLVRTLYQDQNHRRAIRLIMDSLPTFGAILPRASARIFAAMEDMSDEEFSLETDPEKQVDRLREIYLKPRSLRKLTKPHGYIFYYILHRDYKTCGWGTPDIGDRIVVQLAAWCKQRSAKETVTRLNLERSLPPSKEGIQSFDSWQPVWAAGSYTLRDFDTQDVQGCSQLLIDAITTTYPMLRDALEQQYGTLKTDD